MGYSEQVALRPQISVALKKVALGKILFKFAMLVVLLLAGIDQARAKDTSPDIYVVNNDRGGSIRDRLIELRYLRASGQRVEIRGEICFSTCTMLLGLPQTCISPNTTFGFHGPSKSGKQLKPDRFEYFSRVISQYYPVPLQTWYMSTGRNRISRMYRIKGTEIVRMGVRAC